MMNRRVELIIITFSVIVSTAVGSHLIVSRLGVRTSNVSYRVAGSGWQKHMGYVAGSSLLGDALDIEQMCGFLERGLQTWFVAGGSPSEWEQFQSRAKDAPVTIIGVSAYDLNEHFFCDVQANIVPLSCVIRDLIQSQSDWGFAKRVLSQYPMKYLRVLFPAIGRSQGVMGGVKERLMRIIRPDAKVDSDAGPRVPTWGGVEVDPTRQERISNWDSGYLLRRVAKLKSACQGRHSFNGPKGLALSRMLEYAHKQGNVLVVVLPVSHAYHSEFLDEMTMQQFETAIAAHQNAVPGVRWVRLDTVSELQSNDLFWDLVHMNACGKMIATATLFRNIGKPLTTP